MMEDAVKETGDGVILDLEISPGSKETSVRGYNRWRRRIEIKLSERAQKGKANEQLISFLSELFDVHSRNVEIMTGMTNSKKTVKISGKKASDILTVLKK
ncbi:MAG: YggU family protein [Candidatus Methanoperedens sp.]|nr:YggU family protein [Candidatus Methanoperedens sp.]MCE8424930.1 YggU family protein [Candidatus Methanoperedens sp.]MCE8427466.1 YggU family protein [Candidatus Methanoperedens sp.]